MDSKYINQYLYIMKFKGIIKEILEEQMDAVAIGKAIYDKFTGGNKKPVAKGPLPFNEKNLSVELKKQGVRFPDVALAQARLETGHYKSDVFKDNNNLFGMKHPSVRQTVSKGKNRGHANYTTWQDSVKDYKLWQDFYKVSSMSKDQYINKLNKVYCIAPVCKAGDYAKKVQSLMGFGSITENVNEGPSDRAKQVAKNILSHFILDDVNEQHNWIVDNDTTSRHSGSFSLGDPYNTGDESYIEYYFDVEWHSRSKFYPGSYDEPPSSDPAEFDFKITAIYVYGDGRELYNGPDFTNFEKLKLGVGKYGRDITGLDFVYDMFGGTMEDLEYNDDDDDY